MRLTIPTINIPATTSQPSSRTRYQKSAWRAAIAIVPSGSPTGVKCCAKTDRKAGQDNRGYFALAVEVKQRDRFDQDERGDDRGNYTGEQAECDDQDEVDPVRRHHAEQTLDPAIEGGAHQARNRAEKENREGQRDRLGCRGVQQRPTPLPAYCCRQRPDDQEEDLDITFDRLYQHRPE